MEDHPLHLTTNVGTADRAVRIILGLLLVALTLMGTIGIWGWLGLVLVATGFLKFCPAYSLLGVRTCKAS